MLTPTALLVVAATGLAWTGLDLLRKLLVEEVTPLALLFWLTAAQVPLFGVWAWVAGPSGFAPGYLWPAAGSVVLNIAANWCFNVAVAVSPLSLTIPLLSLTPVFTSLLGVPLLGELPSALQWLGIALVVAGAFTLSLGAAEGVTLRAVIAALARGRGSLLMALVAFLWSLALPLDKLAMEASSVALHGLVLTSGVAAGVLGMLAARRQLGELGRISRVPKRFAAAVVVSGLALGLQLVALQLAWVSLVETLKRGIGNFMSLLLGRAVFGEPVTRSKLLAVALMAAGVALVLG